MIHIFDDALSEDMLKSVQSQMWDWPTGDSWFDFGVHPVCDHMIEMASKYFDVSGAVGYEMHRNDLSPNPHYDKDEVLYSTTGQLSFPMCGIVYYPWEENLNMGHIVFDEIAVKPKINRLIIFRGDLFHSGIPHTGVRVSIGINPWKEKPLAYQQEK